jgi:hypothetical protein
MLMHQEDIVKTTFWIHHGHFKFLVMACPRFRRS